MGEKRSVIKKWLFLMLLVGLITTLHYSTDQGQYYYHAFYGELYFLPIALAAYWFQLPGALIVSTTISICYLPVIFSHWQSFSPRDLDRILSVLLYNALAVLAGILRGRETAAQKQLLQIETLAVMGRSLAAVAHDMKTPLVAIGSCARRLMMKSTNDQEKEKLALIVKETDRMESMTKNMLDFAKPLKISPVSGLLETTVQDCLGKLSEVSRRKNIVLEYSCSAEVLQIKIDTLRLEQALANLVGNAIEASPEGCRVVVRLYHSSDGDLLLDVVDSGCGIPDQKRKEVLNPFFTTKKEGTGLGLPIVKKIVDAHGWTLQILDNQGRGTICRICMKKSNL